VLEHQIEIPARRIATCLGSPIAEARDGLWPRYGSTLRISEERVEPASIGAEAAEQFETGWRGSSTRGAPSSCARTRGKVFGLAV
jgi:hypothetical protein